LAEGIGQHDGHVADVGFILEYWFWIFVFAASVMTGVVFHYASQLSDTWLFALKLISFSTTGLLGVIGVVTDFKDENKNLTTAGKANLVGLVFSAIIGVLTQRAESLRAKDASDAAQKKYEILVAKNNDVLQQVARNLEPIGDTISVSYHAELPLYTALDIFNLNNNEQQVKELNQSLARRASKLGQQKSQALGRDKHTLTLGSVNGTGINVMFDRESSFAREDITRFPLFVLRFFKSKPEFKQMCSAAGDLEFEWDKSQQRTESHVLDSMGMAFDDLIFQYQSSNLIPALIEDADDSKFKPTRSSGSVVSALDLSRAYVQLLNTQLVRAKLYNLTLRTGTRQFVVNVKKPIGDGCFDNVYQLPVIQSASAN
jgi:hypothetical protein